MTVQNILKNITKIMASTFLSRILGYARDMAIASYFGANITADAFYVAYRIPNLLRRLLGEGSLIAAFVPVYTEYLHNKPAEEQQKFLDTIATLLGIVLFLITILGIIFAPTIISLIAPGYTHSSNAYDLAVILTRIMFPFFIMIGLAALLMGVLHSHHIFIYTALAPCFLSLSELFFIFVIAPFTAKPIQTLAIGVVVGGFLQFLFQLIPIIIKKIKYTFQVDFKNEGFRRVVKLMIPSTIAVSVDQINAFVDVICATWLVTGSVSALYYANHLMLFPLGIFGVAVCTVSLPVFSKSAVYNDINELKHMLRNSLRIMAFFIVPSMIGLIVLSMPIIRLLFEHGKFDAFATSLTTNALIFYALGLISYSGVKIIATVFYSLKNTKTPVIISSISMLVNITLNFLLMKYLGVGGLALATAISSTVNVLLLIYMLRKTIGNLQLFSLVSSFMKILVSSIIMGIVCYFLAYKIFDWSRILSVIMPVCIGSVVYISFIFLFRTQETKYIKEAITALRAKISV